MLFPDFFPLGGEEGGGISGASSQPSYCPFFPLNYPRKKGVLHYALTSFFNKNMSIRFDHGTHLFLSLPGGLPSFLRAFYFSRRLLKLMQSSSFPIYQSFFLSFSDWQLPFNEKWDCATKPHHQCIVIGKEGAEKNVQWLPTSFTEVKVKALSFRLDTYIYPELIGWLVLFNDTWSQ